MDKREKGVIMITPLAKVAFIHFMPLIKVNDNRNLMWVKWPIKNRL